MNFENMWLDLYNEIGEFEWKFDPDDEWDRGYRWAFRDIKNKMDQAMYEEIQKERNEDGK